MLELDGAEAGGQYLRSALSLAAVEDRPVRIEHVRGDRSTPGLRPQHLAVVETIAAICDADVAGAETGSETIVFEPDLGSGDPAGTETGPAPDGRIPGGTYAADIGTAGSVTLLFDAVLPLATRLRGPLTLTASGGTDVKWSPTLASYRRVKLPLLREFGLQAAIDVDRRGFYPAGGGRATLHLAPSTMRPVELDERGSLEDVRLYSTESSSLAERDVAERQLAAAIERLEARTGSRTDGDEFPNTDGADLPITERVVRTVDSESPGSAICCRLAFETGCAGTDALGERGIPAERVGEEAATAAGRILEGTSPVDRHLADQLLCWLALAGGRLRIPAMTDHVETSLSLLDAFGYELDSTPASAATAASEDSDVSVITSR